MNLVGTVALIFLTFQFTFVSMNVIGARERQEAKRSVFLSQLFAPQVRMALQSGNISDILLSQVQLPEIKLPEVTTIKEILALNDLQSALGNLNTSAFNIPDTKYELLNQTGSLNSSNDTASVAVYSFDNKIQTNSLDLTPSENQLNIMIDQILRKVLNSGELKTLTDLTMNHLNKLIAEINPKQVVDKIAKVSEEYWNQNKNKIFEAFNKIGQTGVKVILKETENMPQKLSKKFEKIIII